MINMFDESVFPEMIMLRRAQRRLKEAWVHFKHTYKEYISHGSEEIEG
jgi:hypothetical protein